MKRKIGVAALLALWAMGVLAPAAHAQCGGGILIKFDADCFSYETSVTQSTVQGGFSTWKSNANSSLTVVGLITLFCAPLNGNQPNLPAKEYTFIWSGLTSAGTVESNYLTTGKRWDTDYGPGTFEIWEESPADAPRATTPMPSNPPNATVPANFVDGTKILNGTISGLHTIVTRTSNTASAIWGGSFTSTYAWTPGGTQYGLVANYGPSVLSGTWCAKFPSGCAPTGYTAHPAGKWDLGQPTEVRASTWGAIKELYR